jgi:hypothetical protein
MNTNLKNKTMRNYKKYRSTVLSLFQSFLAEEINKITLVYELIKIETELKQGRDTLKSVWFKFFKSDVGATDIRDLSNDNYDTYHKECMQLSIDNPKELKIYYS